MTFSIICKGHAPSSKGHQSQCHGPLAIKETTLSRKAITGFTRFLGYFHSLQGPFQGPPFLGSFPVPWKAPLTVSDNPPCFRCNHYWPPIIGVQCQLFPDFLQCLQCRLFPNFRNVLPVGPSGLYTQSGLTGLWASPFPIINEGHPDLPLSYNWNPP